MKNIYRVAITIFTVIIFSNVDTEAFQTEICSCSSGIGFHKITSRVDQPFEDRTLNGQIILFKEALDELGATSPEQVIKIWAKAEDTRNGVFHYAVACDELKSKIIKEWGNPEQTYWIYGGSSPWLDKYEIVYNKRISASEYKAKIKFFWATSFSPIETTETTLTIIRKGNVWCVREADKY